ncbi:MAG TPA: glucokinase [Thermodesulfobacteriaceae bacterium]|nr:glucokinase [Thermodesulfobacteriaceae bacterium]
MQVLAGDIGGTNTRLAVMEDGRILLKRHYPSGNFSDFQAVLSRFLSELPGNRPLHCCLAVAGIVKNDTATPTNISWSIDGSDLKNCFSFDTVRLINDFEAAAWGTLLVSGTDLVQIGGGHPVQDGPRAVLGAGTGLGQALVVPCQGGHQVLPGEGGHADFAPGNEKEVRLLKFLWRRFSHVSMERVLSGPGLVNIHRFLSSESVSRDNVADIDSHGKLTPAEIARNAVEEIDTLCTEALTMFARIYGAEAGNLALRSLATGGVYVAGGIAPRILAVLERGDFRNAFEDKGRMRKFLRDIPVFVVTTGHLGLLGAGFVAGREQ